MKARGASLALALSALALGAGVAEAAAPLKLSATPTAVPPGGSVHVRYALKRAPARLVLKLDRRTLKTVAVRSTDGRTRVTVPRNAAPGSHRLAACVKRECRSLTLRILGSGPAGGMSNPATAEPAEAIGGATPPPPSGPPPSTGDFTGPANPLDAIAHVDPSRRATTTIGTAGGTLETTGADGTSYTLTVPFGALLSEERISMTPIAAVDGLPYSGGLAAGVQLEPSGLRFADFATLEIDGSPPLPPHLETGFLYQGDGEELQLYPAERDGSTTRFRIMHFSGVGVASGTEAERNAQMLRAATDVEGRLYQQLSALFRPGESVDEAAAGALLRGYHDQILRPLVEAATVDDGLAIQAINRYFGWGRLVHLLFDEEFMAAERRELTLRWIEIVKNAAIKAHRRCVDQSRPEELPMILSWWRQIGLMELDLEMPTDVWTAVWSCARFELDFRTKLSQDLFPGEEGYTVWTGEVIAENLIIEPDPLSLRQHGTKEAQYVDFDVYIPPHEGGCWIGGGDWVKTFPLTVSELAIDINPIQRPDGSYGYPEFERGRIKLSLVPFSASEYQYYADCGLATGSGGWGMWLAPLFMALHEDRLNDESGGIVFTDWTVPAGGGSMLGAKTYFRTFTFEGDPTREETTLELYHAPKTAAQGNDGG